MGAVTRSAAVLAAAVVLAACKQEPDWVPDMLSPPAGLDPDAPPSAMLPGWSPDADTSWQWQLQGTIDTSYDAALYDVDLFETPDDVIAALHAADRRVVCYFSAGSGEDYRDDYDRFLDSDLAKPLDGWPGERWLDVRSANVVQIMADRIAYAAERGCDGVEPDNVAAFEEDTGFALSARDQLAFNRHLANLAHEAGLAVALKNDGTQALELVDYFDFELNEQCHEYDECDALAPFVEAGKAVLNAEYAGSAAKAEALATSLCPAAAAAHTRTLILPLELDDAFRVACP